MSPQFVRVVRTDCSQRGSLTDSGVCATDDGACVMKMFSRARTQRVEVSVPARSTHTRDGGSSLLAHCVRRGRALARPRAVYCRARSTCPVVTVSAPTLSSAHAPRARRLTLADPAQLRTFTHVARRAHDAPHGEGGGSAGGSALGDVFGLGGGYPNRPIKPS